MAHRINLSRTPVNLQTPYYQRMLAAAPACTPAAVYLHSRGGLVPTSEERRAAFGSAPLTEEEINTVLWPLGR